MGSMIRARDLLEFNPEHTWSICDQVKQVEFDDGVLDIIPRLLPISRYMWLYQELFPETPLNKNSMLTSPYITPSSCQDILNTGYWDCYYSTGERDVHFREYLSKMGTERLNLLYNHAGGYCASAVRGIDAGDYLDLIRHPPIAEIRRQIKTDPNLTPRKLIIHYDDAKTILLTDPLLDRNPAAIAVRCKSMKIDQLIQVIIARGYGSDVDSVIFPNAVRDAYIDGIRTLEGVLIDACSASRAIFYQKKPTQDSEYLNRRLRMNAAVLKNLHHVDCGSNIFVETYVATKSMLGDLAGKFMWGDDGKMYPIRKSDKHLIGKLIKRRSNFSCIHPDRNGLCAKCYGAIALSVPDQTNLGVVSTTTVLSILVQLLLSAKHIILSSVGDIGDLKDSESYRWMYVDKTNPLNSYIYLNDIFKDKKIKLSLRPSEAKMLVDLKHVEDIEEVSVSRMTAINTLLFSVPATGSDDYMDDWSLINIGNKENPFSLSLPMLKYIVNHGYEVDEYGNYVIDMSQWDVKDAFLNIPVTQQSIPLFIAGIDQFITSSSDIKGVTKKDQKEQEEQNKIQEFLRAKQGKNKRNVVLMPRITDFDDPMHATNALYEIVSQKLNVNITHLETMVLAQMAADPEGRDYRLPLDRRHSKIISYTQAMRYRSISALLAYEEQANALYDIGTHLVKHRAHHPYDELFKHLI